MKFIFNIETLPEGVHMRLEAHGHRALSQQELVVMMLGALDIARSSVLDKLGVCDVSVEPPAPDAH